MVTREELQGKWNEVKGRLQEQWGQLTDEDFRFVEGGADRLVGAIQQKTGATRREIEHFLDGVVNSSGRISEHAKEYADHAADAVRDGYRRASDTTSDLGRRVGETVSSRPIEAILVAGLVGVIAGCLFSMTRKR